MVESSVYAFLSRKMYIHRCRGILFLLTLSVYGEVSDVGFTESPYSMMVTVGTRATFRCRHETADVIGWRVNGTSIGQVGNPDFIPGTIRRGDGSLVHILTVVVHPEYNDTIITCVAAFLRQELPLELSSPVTLTVFEGNRMYMYTHSILWYKTFILLFQDAMRPAFMKVLYNNMVICPGV